VCEVHTHFGENHDLAAAGRQQVEMGLHGPDLFLDRPCAEFGAVPAGDELQTEFPQLRLEGIGLFGKFVAHLGPGETGLAGFAQAGFQGGVAAQLGQVVIAPGNRIGAQFHRHGSLLVLSCLLILCCCVQRTVVQPWA
jgi:hypothetical protein